MKLKWPGRDLKAPKEITDAVDLTSGEKILAHAATVDGDHVVATTADFVVLHGGKVLWRRPWMEVDTGKWDPDEWVLTMTWADRSAPARFALQESVTRIPEVFHERVQASVVLSAKLPTTGPKQAGKVAIRKDFRSGRLHEQRVFGRGTDPRDPQVREAVEAVSAQLRDQVGL